MFSKKRMHVQKCHFRCFGFFWVGYQIFNGLVIPNCSDSPTTWCFITVSAKYMLFVVLTFYLFLKGNENFSRKTLGDVSQKYWSQMVRNILSCLQQIQLTTFTLWGSNHDTKDQESTEEKHEEHCTCLRILWPTIFLQNDWMYFSPQKCERNWRCERTVEGHVKWGGRMQVDYTPCSIS